MWPTPGRSLPTLTDGALPTSAHAKSERNTRAHPAGSVSDDGDDIADVVSLFQVAVSGDDVVQGNTVSMVGRSAPVRTPVVWNAVMRCTTTWSRVRSKFMYAITVIGPDRSGADRGPAGRR